MLSFMVIAVVYMVGNVINFKPLKDWYRKELWETIKTIIVIGVVISALVILSGVADMLVGAPYIQPLQQSNQNALSTNLANLYNADNIYVGQQLNASYEAYAAMLGLSMGVAMVKSTSLYLWVPIPLWVPPTDIILGAIQFGTIAPLLQSNFITATQGESSFSLTQSLTTTVIVPLLILFQFQSDFFYYLMTLGLGILIPVGIIFRAFPLVRDIGGTLIATGIGIALVYPALLLILNLPISNYLYSFTYSQTPSGNCPFASGLTCNGWNALQTFTNSLTPDPTASPSGLGVLDVGSAFVRYPLRVAFGANVVNNANVIGAMNTGYYVGLTTPLTSGIYPTLNFMLAEALGMILQFILIAIDLLVGLLITGAVTNMLGGKVKLGIGSKLGISTGR
jgi:hypothetical protein